MESIIILIIGALLFGLNIYYTEDKYLDDDGQWKTGGKKRKIKFYWYLLLLGLGICIISAGIESVYGFF